MPRAVDITLNGEQLPAINDVSVLASHAQDDEAAIEVQVGMWQPKVMPTETSGLADVGAHEGSRNPSESMLNEMSWTMRPTAVRSVEEQQQGVFVSTPPGPGEYTYHVEAPWMISDYKDQSVTTAALTVADPANPSAPSEVKVVAGTSLKFQCSEVDGQWMMTGLTATKEGTGVEDLLQSTRNPAVEHVWILRSSGAQGTQREPWEQANTTRRRGRTGWNRIPSSYAEMSLEPAL